MVISYIGYLPEGKAVIGGAEVKTKSVLKALRESKKFNEIITVDTSEWKSRIFSTAIKIIRSVFKSDAIVVVAGRDSFLKTFRLIKELIKKKHIYYIPVGKLEVDGKDTSKIKLLEEVDAIFVQTEKMKEELSVILNNVSVMHNFKYIRRNFSIHNYNSGMPYKFCYVGRVSEVKGIFETIEVFKKININSNIRCILDIYGKIDESIKERFFNSVNNLGFISYKGILQPEETANVIKDYYMFVFPTKFDGEGFPGSIIDAFAAGVPVLSSRFAYYNDILKENVTAVSFEFNNYSDMYLSMIGAINNPGKINSMRINCWNEYHKYKPSVEINKMITEMMLLKGQFE